MNGPLSVHAIAGTYGVLLGIDMEEAASRGVLGFAIERTDHTEDERYWLRGLRTFEQTDPGVPGVLVSTLEHPFQSFLWGDYTAKTRHSYTYRVVAMRGKPKKLEQREEVEVRIETEDDAAEKHAVFFNRGVAGSQAYSRKFGNRAPDDVPGGEAWRWLSRGLEEALLAFIRPGRRAHEDDLGGERRPLCRAKQASPRHTLALLPSPNGPVLKGLRERGCRHLGTARGFDCWLRILDAREPKSRAEYTL